MMMSLRREYEAELDAMSAAVLEASAEVFENSVLNAPPNLGRFTSRLVRYLTVIEQTAKKVDDITIIPHTKQEAEMVKRDLFHGGYTFENINMQRSRCTRNLESGSFAVPTLMKLIRKVKEKPGEMVWGASAFDPTNADPFSIAQLIRTARALRDSNNISIECLEIQLMAVRGHYWATVLIRNSVPENKALRFVAHEAQFGNEIDADKVLDVWDAAGEAGLPDQLINALYGAEVFY